MTAVCPILFRCLKDLITLFLHLIATLVKLMGPGGARSIVADSLLMKQQLLVISRSRQRAPNLTTQDRFLLGLWSLLLGPRHIRRRAIIIKPSTLLRFHDILKMRKYRLLYSSGKKRKTGPKGPSQELVKAIVDMKQRNPRYGCPKIAEQIETHIEDFIDFTNIRKWAKSPVPETSFESRAINRARTVMRRYSVSTILRY